MRSSIKGRTLWCAGQLVEILPKDYEDIHLNILNIAISFLTEEQLISVKLVATKCLVKSSRKLKPDLVLSTIGSKFENILDELSLLLDQTSVDIIYLPIESFTYFSRLN